MKQDILSEKQLEALDFYHIPDAIKKDARLLTFQKGELLCKEGEYLPYLLLLIAGKVKVCVTEANGKTLLLSFYDRGSILGDIELMLDNPGTTTATAITTVRCVGLPMNSCRHELTENLTFMKYTAQTIAIKLEASARRTATNMLHTLESRLCAYIIATSENEYFQENLTEIAELLGTSYRHLLRSMASLCKHQILQKCSRTRYKIIDSKGLQMRAKDCL